MIRKTLAALATVAVVLAPTATATGAVPDTERAAAGITGSWKGGVYGDDGGPAGYTAKVKIFKKGGKLAGKITYPKYCSGKWTFQGKRNGWFTFREKITRGSACVSPVSAKAKRVGKKLKVVWREPQTGDTASMKARRT
ncbi:hypothetical protein GCM10027062_34370 [Nocardioides hungaricus]